MTGEPSTKTEQMAGTPDVDVRVLAAGLGSGSQLERSRRLSSLGLLLKTNACTPDDLVGLEAAAASLLVEARWEARLGGLELARLLVKYGVGSTATTETDALRARLCPPALLAALLEDPEVRVRKAVGELLGDMSKTSRTVWDELGGTIVESIERNYSRDDCSSSADVCDPTDDPEALESLDPIASLLHQSYKTVKPGVGEMRHDTEGWRCLETSFAALDAVMVGYGREFGPYVLDGESNGYDHDHDNGGGNDGNDGNATIPQLVFKSAKHPNRFIRETSQRVMGTLCDILDEDRICGPTSRFRVELGSNIGFGLSDNWSQVRYAASVAVRKFVTKATTEEHRALCLPLVLPQLCLNRYYVADGVRFYSQQTWQAAVGADGRAWVARCIQTVVSYYVEQTKANNHTVREAACSCVSELVSKVDSEVVAPHVPRLLSCLLTSFRDASWPVRNAACLATGRCVVAFPEESRGVSEKLYKLWFAHLEDNVFSVREDSAVALGDAVRAYGPEAVERVRAALDELLLKAREQEPETKSGAKSEGGGGGETRAGGREGRDQDQLVASCGSLARKVATSKDCCGDYAAFRPPEPWEASDGAIYLVRELAAVAPEAAVDYMPTLAELSRLTHFAVHTSLHETLWKCLPDIGQSIGKAAFKREVNLFLEPLVRDARRGHGLCGAAASKCVSWIEGFMGKSVLEGRLSELGLR